MSRLTPVKVSVWVGVKAVSSGCNTDRSKESVDETEVEGGTVKGHIRNATNKVNRS